MTKKAYNYPADKISPLCISIQFVEQSYYTIDYTFLQ